MARYLANTFSPAMLGEYTEAEIYEVNLQDVPPTPFIKSVVGHKITADILTALLGEKVKCNRENVVLEAGDFMYCIIPKFRCAEAREFTHEEVVDAGFRVFIVKVSN